MEYGLDNEITIFKNRDIDVCQPVMVYRCLNRKGVVFSIWQQGKVVAHTTSVMLTNAKFIIRKAGQQMARDKKMRNVHAFVKGTITLQGACGVTSKSNLPARIQYNPFKDDSFICTNLTMNPFPVSGAWFVVLNQQGMSGVYVEKE